MSAIDYGILAGFMVWMLVIGAIYSRRLKNSADMFAASRSSPWWVSGLSGFMTIFSAGTFVVWGGIAYRLGLVGVSILMVTGLSIVLIGLTVAARWHETGIGTPSEFMRLRFSDTAVQVYTWLGTFYRGIGMAVGLYSLAVMLAVLVPLPEGAPLRDPATGNLSVAWGILLWGTVVVAYTMAGGLWAVLMTDVIQCIILCLVVLVAVPLSLGAVGGVGAFWSQAPKGFFFPASAEYSASFLGLWFFVGYFRYASDWAFVQRYICVPTPRDAKKAAYLMAGLYLVSPIVWLLPAMAYRMLDAEASPEEAYMLMCRRVLPAGMLGMMVAAMFSATASTVSGLLNVFAAAFTCDVYKARLHPEASERHLLMVGRLSTAVYGSVTIGGALLVPYFGAEDVVLTLVTLLMGPMMLPPVWGLYSRRIGQGAIWATLAFSAAAAIVAKLGPAILPPSVLADGRVGAALGWMEGNPRLVEAMVGVALPVGILLVIEWIRRGEQVDAGWLRLKAAMEKEEVSRPTVQERNRLPGQLVSVSLGMLGAVMGGVTIQAGRDRGTLGAFTMLLVATAVGLGWRSFRGGARQE